MSEHVFDELPQLLSGGADRSEVACVAAHLRSCEDCRDELISVVVAHAALTSAVRLASDMAPSNAPAISGASAAEVLPDLSATFTRIRDEVSAAKSAGSKRVRYRWLAAAAVLAVGVGGSGAILVDRNLAGAPSSRSVALSAFDEGTSTGSAVLIGDNTMKLDAASLPALAAGKYYEVWLTNGARTTMAPVGQLNSAGDGTYVVPANVMSGYGAIEVSVQDTQANGAYSGVSVLRGSYA